jgi:MFS family permease
MPSSPALSPPRALRDALTRLAGGPRRARVIALLAAVLGLQTADTSTIGAIAPELQRALGISYAQLGLLTSVPLAVAAVATVPVGILADRTCRTRLLAVVIALAAAALVAAGASASYVMLLIVRVALGAAMAAAWPLVASLTGDLFAPAERGRIYGLILSGELVGAGLGYLVSGTAAGLLSWRFAFWILAVPTLALAALVRRRLPEPARGGRDRFPSQGGDGDEGDHELAQEVIVHEGVEPDPDLVLRRDPQRMALWRAVRYVLRLRTNVVLIGASSLAYFFLAGQQVFALVYVRERFDLAQAPATLLLMGIASGALIGVLVGGRIADAGLRRGRATARLDVGGWSYLASAALFLGGLLVPSLPVAVGLFFVAAGALTAANPPLDAARLDVMHSRLWGRAESVRNLLRTAAQALAPVLLGLVADALGGAPAGRTPTGRPQPSVLGLEVAFGVMVVALAVGGLFVLRARRHYPRDVATSAASERATA